MLREIDRLAHADGGGLRADPALDAIQLPLQPVDELDHALPGHRLAPVAVEGGGEAQHTPEIGIECRHPPPVLLLQGNDTVKETLVFVEDELVRNGLAVLNVDQPGWGESRLSGNRYRSLEDAQQLVDRCVSFIEHKPLLDKNKLVVFGFSGGGTWAAMAAAINPEIRWMVTIGGAIYNLAQSVSALPAMQKRQCIKHWGCTEKEIPEIIKEIGLNDLVSRITARCLIVHGEKDTLVPVENTRMAAERICGPVELRIVPGGDHMCSATLVEKELPYVMDWLRTEVGRDMA